MSVTKLLLVGSGKWGQNYISTLANFPEVSLTVANRNNWKDLIDQQPDGVMVCTPPQSHVEIASYALAHDIPTMIEKPLALSLEEAITLQQYSAPILVNHTYLFADSYQYIKRNIGQITDIRSAGIGSNFHSDYSGLWDYGPHDIAMILDLAQQYPKSICCTKLARLFDINLEFDGFISYSCVGQSISKIRKLVVDNHNNTYYDSFYEELPLTNALKVFIGAIHGQPDYRLGLDLSLNVLRVLEKCRELLDNNTFQIR